MAVQRDKVSASAEKLVAKGKIEPAIKEYERLLEDNPNDVNTLNRIGDLWVRINRNDEAVKTFGRIADFYAKDGFFLKAIAIYKKINKLDPSKLEVYGKLADLYAKQGLAMEAKSQYQVLADYYIKHNDPNSALGIYRKISELDPNSINVHVKLADLHSQAGQTAEALKEYDRVGRMLLKRSMLDEAVQVFKKALKIDAKNVELVESLITALLEAKDYDNAIKIVETALETNRNNPKLLGLWAKIQLARGDVNSARSTLEKALAADPNEASVRETLADLYLKQQNANKALEMIAPLAERYLARGERSAAVEMINRVLRVDPKHTPTLELLVATYSRLNEETNILASMNSLAEAHIANKNFEKASKALEKLIDREPQNSQHRTKLTFVKSQMGESGTSTGPRKAFVEPPPPPPPMLEIEEPPPTFDSVEEVEEMGAPIEMEDAPIELDMSLDNVTGPITAMSPPPRIEPDQEVAYDTVAESDDLDFITEHLTEAEVFAKYGLAEKAAEHVRAVINRAPRHLGAHDRLFRILLDEGDVDDARIAAEQYVALLEEKADSATIDNVRQEFLSRGHSWEAGKRAQPAKAAPPAMERPIEATPMMESEAALVSDFDQEEEVSFDLDSSAEVEAEAIPETVSQETVEEEIGLPATEIAFEQEELSPDESQPFFGVEALESREDVTIEPEPVVAAQPEFQPELEFEPEPEPEPEPVATAPTAEQIAEIDRFVGSRKYVEAQQKVEALIAQFPDSQDLLKRQLRIDA
ncbi:MAG: tetratricopeptide repeat protein, partial [Thermoanaerobaculia bacterium]